MPSKHGSACMCVISTLGRQRQEDHKFQISLGYVVRSYLKQTEKKPGCSAFSQLLSSVALI
jgi:hypothetical protein